MPTALSLSSVEDIYELFFRREAHRLIALGYEKSRCKINCKLEETEITGFICEKIEEQLIIDPRLFHYSLKEDNPTKGENRTGKSRRRLDIVIQCSYSIPRQNYIFEAKRLATSGYPIGKYLGEEGLQLFIDGIYACDCPEVGMIGYVQKGSFEHWEKELCQQLPITTELLARKKPKKIKIIDDLEYEWVSKHDRKINKPVTVYHIFLDCS
jgi:hypothetical protein